MERKPEQWAVCVGQEGLRSKQRVCVCVLCSSKRQLANGRQFGRDVGRAHKGTSSTTVVLYEPWARRESEDGSPRGEQSSAMR